MFIKIDLSEKPKIIIEQNKSIIELENISFIYDYFTIKTAQTIEKRINHAIKTNIEQITIKL